MTTVSAFNHGMDCGKNGPDTTNCSFEIFSSPENTAAWESGKKAGESTKKERAK